MTSIISIYVHETDHNDKVSATLITIMTAAMKLSFISTNSAIVA